MTSISCFGSIRTLATLIPKKKVGNFVGGVVSPVLATVYLPYALDLWVENVVKPPGRGEALRCRDADDWVCAFRLQEDAERFVRGFPNRLEQFNLQVALEKTPLRRFSRFHPSTKRRFTFLGFAFFWMPDRHGVPRVMRRTARKKLHAACQRLTEWIKPHRHLPGRAFFQRLHARRRGHSNDAGVRGNSRSLNRFCHWAMDWTFTWLNRRGGKQRSDTWAQFPHVLDRVKRARPRITEVPRRRVFA
jgi:RNA-directed DNA polymerase